MSFSTPARVALASREHYVVWTPDGEIEATISGRLRHTSTELPVVGDFVRLRNGAVIDEILPRRTKLSRKDPGTATREQVLAANMDVLFIVSGLDADYNPRRLERYLILAHESGAQPVVLLNKSDLRGDLDNVLARTAAIAPGIAIHATSALTGAGLDAVGAHLVPGQTAALIGSSGAGKSTILNSLLGEQRQRTTEVRAHDSRGRHTTVHRELIRMPAGWLLIDLPGLRELQLWADPERIDGTFAEIARIAARCRFRDCTHQHEPGCAVRESGVDLARLGSFHKLQRELAYLERESGSREAHNAKRKWKSMHKALRDVPKKRT